MAGRDITEGRATRAIAVDLNVSTGAIWVNTGDSYDVAIGGVPFLLDLKDNQAYERSTAPFRKQQFDSQRDPGEQSLTGWWLRSQSSFHTGEGIEFYDPLANPYVPTIASNSYRIKSAYGVDIWTPGRVSLLRNTTQGHIATGAIKSNGRSNQHLRSIQWTTSGVTYNGVLFHDEYDIDRIHEDGTVDQWYDVTAGGDKVYTLTDDGTTAYWVTNDSTSGKLEIDKKDLAATSGSTASVLISHPSIVVTNAVIEYVKQRLVACINNKVYEFPTSASTLPTEIYTHPNTNYVFTSIAETGGAIYVAGYSGIKSSILKFTLSTAGAMPTLTSGWVAAELPAGEVVHKIYGYLGFLIIGTSKGIRVASTNTDGSLTYGPLIVHTTHPCYDFAARDSYVWCATGVEVDDVEPGVIRINLGEEIEPLRFAYAKDLHYDAQVHSETTACAFIGTTDRLVFSCAAEVRGTQIVNKALTSNVATITTSSAHNLSIGNTVWIEGVGAPFNSGSPYTGETVIDTPTSTSFTYARVTSNVTSTAVTSSTAVVKLLGHTFYEHATDLFPSGYVETGFIRYNTLEQKHFKRLVGHGDFSKGSMSLATVAQDGNIYDVNSYDSVIGSPESTITQPIGAQDAIALRFTLYRDATDATQASIFKGYQLKAVPATPRSRIIKVPVLNFDTETDKYNTTLGWEGRAFERLTQLESIERNGDVVSFQDFRTGEIFQCLIEEVAFVNMTPPDKKLTNFGGVITVTLRTV